MTSPRFHLRAKVASPGFSEVWRAYDHRLETEIALKRPAATAQGQSGIDSLERELQALRHLQHPHLVSLLDDGTDETGRFLCLEWIHGETLDMRITRLPLTIDQTKALLRALLSGLSAVHATGFAHGDIKADNLILDAYGHATLIDFGNATPLGLPAPDKIGSIHAMAPELFEGQPRSVATDLYAAGVLAYHCVSGQLPFQGETKPQVITAHVRHLRVPLSQICPVPPAFDTWIEKMVSPDVSQRPASAEAARRLLLAEDGAPPPLP